MPCLHRRRLPAHLPRPPATRPARSPAGARGLLAVEEERVLRLREERESEAQRELQAARLAYEEEVRRERQSADQLCATPFGVDVVGITEFIALTGALVGGARRCCGCVIVVGCAWVGRTG